MNWSLRLLKFFKLKIFLITISQHKPASNKLRFIYEFGANKASDFLTSRGFYCQEFVWLQLYCIVLERRSFDFHQTCRNSAIVCFFLYDPPWISIGKWWIFLASPIKNERKCWKFSEMEKTNLLSGKQFEECFLEHKLNYFFTNLMIGIVIFLLYILQCNNSE